MSVLTHLGVAPAAAAASNSFPHPNTTALTDGGSDNDNDDEKPSKNRKVKGGGFQSYQLPPFLFKSVMGLGFNVPTPVQRASIPSLLAGKDLIAMARTGSGKTAAFLLPMLVKLCQPPPDTTPANSVRALILAPTRELAEQTHSVAKQLAKYFPANTNFRSTLLVGGSSINAQFESLESKPSLIVATPGRLLHHIIEVGFSLRYVELLVFDEADRLLELGFAPQIAEITKKLNDSRQTALVSATMPDALIQFARTTLRDPHVVRLDKESQISPLLRMGFLLCRTSEKLASLLLVLRNERFAAPKTCLIFAATRHRVEFIHSLLTASGISSAPVYGQLDPAARKINVAKFKSGRVSTLIVTDVAARGVDLPFLDAVINFDFPAKPKLFVHRVGRVARAGRPGCAICLVNTEELPYMIDLHLFLGRKPVTKSVEESASENSEAVYGVLPSSLIVDESAYVQSLIDTRQLAKQQTVGERSYLLYQKTRPPASNASAERGKMLPPPEIHPWFNDTVSASSSDTGNGTGSGPKDEQNAASMIRAISQFQAKSTVFEINGSDKSHVVHEIKKKCESIIRKRKERTEQLSHASTNNDSEDDGDSGNKRARVAPFSLDSGSRFRDSAHFIDTVRHDAATESGLSMDSGSNAGLAQLNSLSMEMMGDEANDLMRGKTKSVWDQKRRNYVRVKEGGDPFKAQRNEDGDLVRHKDQPALYEKWQKTKKAKSAAAQRVRDANDRDDDGEDANSSKVQRASFKGKSEIRGADEIRKQRLQREKNKLKHAAKQGKQGGSRQGGGKRGGKQAQSRKRK